jgi:uncharacterized protein YndB with AHSA1/START domain
MIAALLLLAAAPAQIVTEADGSRTLIVDTLVAAPPATVWRAVTTAEGWRGWAATQAWSNPPDADRIETSYDPAARPGGASNIVQRFVARLPGRLLVFRTEKTPADFPNADAFKRVTQFLELIPEGAGTRVRLSGAGYPAGSAGDTLLGFFADGNRETLDKLAAYVAGKPGAELAPLGFLVGHCWRATLANGGVDTHCFVAERDSVHDRHQVVAGGKPVYGGETLYSWDSRVQAIRFVYTTSGGWMAGNVRPTDDGLDFGTTDFVATDGKRVPITVRWKRVGENAYDAIENDVDAGKSAPRRYARID